MITFEGETRLPDAVPQSVREELGYLIHDHTRYGNMAWLWGLKTEDCYIVQRDLHTTATPDADRIRSTWEEATVDAFNRLGTYIERAHRYDVELPVPALIECVAVHQKASFTQLLLPLLVRMEGWFLNKELCALDLLDVESAESLTESLTEYFSDEPTQLDAAVRRFLGVCPYDSFLKLRNEGRAAGLIVKEALV